MECSTAIAAVVRKPNHRQFWPFIQFRKVKL